MLTLEKFVCIFIYFIMLGRSATLYPFIIIQIKFVSCFRLSILFNINNCYFTILTTSMVTISVDPVSRISLLGDFTVSKLLHSFIKNCCLVLIIFYYYLHFSCVLDFVGPMRTNCSIINSIMSVVNGNC